MWGKVGIKLLDRGNLVYNIIFAKLVKTVTGFH